MRGQLLGGQQRRVRRGPRRRLASRADLRRPGVRICLGTRTAALQPTTGLQWGPLGWPLDAIAGVQCCQQACARCWLCKPHSEAPSGKTIAKTWGRITSGALLQVLCDLGTDCADCGPWKFNASGDGSSFQADLPIKRLTSQNVRLWLGKSVLGPVRCCNIPECAAVSGHISFETWSLFQHHWLSPDPASEHSPLACGCIRVVHAQPGDPL